MIFVILREFGSWEQHTKGFGMKMLQKVNVAIKTWISALIENYKTVKKLFKKYIAKIISLTLSS